MIAPVLALTFVVSALAVWMALRPGHFSRRRALVLAAQVQRENRELRAENRGIRAELHRRAVVIERLRQRVVDLEFACEQIERDRREARAELRRS